MIPRRFGRDLAMVLAAVGVLVWCGTRWVAIPWVVRGASMEPTLREGDRVLVDLWTTRHRAPRTGEIVVFRGLDGDDLVKRIARAPGPGDAPYPPSSFRPRDPLGSLYVVLGDNPDASEDSRTFGPVPRERIRGRIAWRYWPLSRAGAIE